MNSPFQKINKKIFASIVLVVVLIGIAGYFVWSKKSNNVINTGPIVQVDTSNWKTYTNTEFGFQLTFPSDWSGYSVVRNESQNYQQDTVNITFSFILKDVGQNYPVFFITAYPRAYWYKLLGVNNTDTLGTYLGENSEFVFTEQRAQEPPLDRTLDPLVNEVHPGIISTFKFTKPSTTLTLKNGVYEDQYMKVTIPDGWTATRSTQTVDYSHCASFKSNCTDTVVLESKPGAIDVTKGNYVLHIDSQAGQASGVEGGRFGEITNNALSVKAAMLDPGAGGFCGSVGVSSAMNEVRSDLFVGPVSDNYKPWCNVPKDGKTVWYFSYVASDYGGYFNYYKNQTSNVVGYVVTMSYNSSDINSLPVKGSAALNTALSEMTNIVNTLELKQK